MAGSKLEQQIIGLFKDVAVAHSILGISRLLNKSYPHVYHKVQELLAQGILIKLVIGNTHLCQVNLLNDTAVGLMTLNEVESRDTFLATVAKAGELLSTLKTLKQQYGVSTAFHYHHTLYLVGPDPGLLTEMVARLKGTAVHCVSEQDFQELMTEQKARQSSVVLIGFEQYFELLRRVQQTQKMLVSP